MFDFPTTPARSSTKKWTALASAGVHALVLVAVVMHRPEPPAPVVQQLPDTFIWDIPQKVPVQHDQPQRSDAPVTPTRAPDFRAPDKVPDLIPPPDLSQAPLDPRTLIGQARTGPLDSRLRGVDPALSPGTAHDWRTVDESPRLLTPGALDYPPS